MKSWLPRRRNLGAASSVGLAGNFGDILMADGNGSGGIGLLGVIIGAVIVVALGYMFLANGPMSSRPSTNVKVEIPKGK